MATQAYLICKKAGHGGKSKRLSMLIKCFFLNRTAVISLMEAIYLLYQQRSTLKSASGSSKYAILMPLLACAQSMLFFDGYGGNQASITALLAELTKVAKSQHAPAEFIRAVQRFSFDSKKHIQLLHEDISYLAGKINADPNGINFTIKVENDNGKTKWLWPKHSDHKRGVDYWYYKTLNGGNFPLTKQSWMALINEHEMPKYEHTINVAKLVKEDDTTFEEVSIEELKKMSFQDDTM